MQLTIDRNEIAAALALAKGIVGNGRWTVPALSHVLIATDADGVTLAATDIDLTARWHCRATVDKPGCVAVEARRLADVVKACPAGAVRFEGVAGGWLEVSGGPARFKVAGLDPADWPFAATPCDDVGAVAILIDAPALREMIDRTLFAVSADETRPNLNGVCLEADAGRLGMIATDGHRLATIARPVALLDLPKPVTIPRKAVAELRRVLKGRSGVVAVRFLDGVADFEAGPVHLSARLIEGTFPDYRQVIPSRGLSAVCVDTAAMLGTLRRLAAVSSERTRGIKLDIAAGGLLCSAINPEAGEVSERVAADVDGPDVAVGFNGRYLADALSVLPKASQVTIEISDNVGPGLIASPADPAFRYVVMPMRL